CRRFGLAAWRGFGGRLLRRTGTAATVAELRLDAPQRGDAVFRVGVGREQIVHALARQRVDDEERGGGRVALGVRVVHGLGRAGDLAERRGEPERLAADFGAAPVGGIF